MTILRTESHAAARSESVADSAVNPTSNLSTDAHAVAVPKIMVIDDSNTIRRSAEIFLGQAGFQVILADDGFDALAKIQDHRPDLIFCDILMPRLDGYQTCALIKKSRRFRATPVIMLSSKDSLFDRARGTLVGSSDYLTKPFTKLSLIAAVRSHTSQANTQSQSVSQPTAKNTAQGMPAAQCKTAS